jgi:hypothetical protein
MMVVVVVVILIMTTIVGCICVMVVQFCKRTLALQLLKTVVVMGPPFVKWGKSRQWLCLIFSP